MEYLQIEFKDIKTLIYHNQVAFIIGIIRVKIYY